MALELRHVVAQMGGIGVFGRSFRSHAELRDAIRQGFPHAVVETLMRSTQLTLQELAESLDLSPRSLQRRKQGRLDGHESDRIYRLARIYSLAEQMIGNQHRAVRWMKQPNCALGGATPLSALDTELGARSVENILGRIAWGGVS